MGPQGQKVGVSRRLHLSPGGGMLLAETPQLILFSRRNVSKSNQETRLSGGNKPPEKGGRAGGFSPWVLGPAVLHRGTKTYLLSRKHQDLSFPWLICSPHLQTWPCQVGNSYQGAFTTLQLKEMGFTFPLVITHLPSHCSPT